MDREERRGSGEWEEFYTLNPETLTCGDYTILVFEDNQAMRSLGQSLMDAGE